MFPVPKGAHIDKFSMEIGGKMVDAELLPAEKARQIYEDIVRKMRDPALLEYAGRDLFKVRIFPIEPRSRKPIKISYTEFLRSDAGTVTYSYPLSTEKFSAQPIKSLSVKVEVKTEQPLASIYSPSHKVEIKRDGANRAVIGYESKDEKPETDFQLVYNSEARDVGLSLITHKPAGEDGYFLILAAPTVAKETKPAPKDVVFVVDTSGSMAGAKLQQAKKALRILRREFERRRSFRDRAVFDRSGTAFRQTGRCRFRTSQARFEFHCRLKTDWRHRHCRCACKAHSKRARKKPTGHSSLFF